MSNSYEQVAKQQTAWSESAVAKYLPLVKRIAGRLAISLPSHVEEEDLVGYGVFGLLEALQRFEPSRGVKFETYAGIRIRGAMIDGLRAMDWVPHSARQKVKQVRKAFENLESEQGSASVEDVARSLNMSEGDVYTNLLKGQYMSMVSLDETVAASEDENGTAAINMLADPRAEEAFNEIEREDQAKILSEAIGRLSEKEQMVLALYYQEELTLREIAAILKLSESRISQIHSQALARLRGALGRHL
ncbi:MAG: FliA/WhiG family RNA polymerase sigma factor [Peptococcaceae bacterium]|nr:FliA/WhiG family RNA polymerase sigma factor [Peptococcaceae bacterium]MDR2736334.1 FliA/WhiG family RNA polymerase sigma factor [Gracilibacteraceae bacterium]